MDRSSSRNIVIALGIYFLLHILVRVFVSPNLELDEAEQLILTQQLSLGYGSQPPLYTWLLSGLFKLFGVSIFPLALLKNLLLLGTYLALYYSALEMGFRRSEAVTATASLLLLPQMAWESQRDLTHSVLVTTVTAVTILLWLMLRRRTDGWLYLLSGFCWGLGFLSKYNYGIFLVGFLLASATLPEYRARLTDRRILLSLTSMIAVLVPHILWIASHLSTTLSQAGKFKQAAKAGYVASVATGAGNLLVASLAFSLPLLLLYSMLAYYGRAGSGPFFRNQTDPVRTLLLRTIFISLGLCCCLVLFFKVTVFKDRWMQPILFFLPLALLPWMETVFKREAGRFLRWFALTVAASVLVLMAARPWIAAQFGVVTRFNLPYQEIARALKPQLENVDLVVAQNRLIGGNLRLAFPHITVAVPEAPLFHSATPRSLLIVWQDIDGGNVSPNFSRLLAGLTGSPLLPISDGTLQAPLYYLPQKVLALSYACIECGVRKNADKP